MRSIPLLLLALALLLGACGPAPQAAPAAPPAAQAAPALLVHKSPT